MRAASVLVSPRWNQEAGFAIADNFTSTVDVVADDRPADEQRLRQDAGEPFAQTRVDDHVGRGRGARECAWVATSPVN